MLLSSYAVGTRALLRFGHGCSCHCVLLEPESYYGLGMDAVVIVCSWNTKFIVVWAWMLWSSYALGTRNLLWFGHRCSCHRMLLEHEIYYGLGMAAPVIVCSWNTKVINNNFRQPLISMKGTSLQAAMVYHFTQTLFTDRGNPTPIPLTNAVYR